MRPTINATRAIGVEFVRRMLRPMIIGGVVLSVGLISFGAWLTTQSVWWWLLEIIFIGASLIFVMLLLVVNVVLRKVEPSLSGIQKQAIVAFVDKLEQVAENIQTPQIIIIYYVVRDTVRPRPNGFVETIARDSKALAPDFARLCKQFEQDE